MSVKLMNRVWDADLPTHLKITALALANFGDDDGERIFPSIGRLAHLTGKTERRVRADVTALCHLGVLVPLTPRTGGGTRTTKYLLDAAALPKLPEWNAKSDTSQDAHVRPEVSEVAPKPEGSQDAHVRPARTSTTLARTSTASSPDVHVRRSVSGSVSSDPLVDPSVIALSREIGFAPTMVKRRRFRAIKSVRRTCECGLTVEDYEGRTTDVESGKVMNTVHTCPSTASSNLEQISA